MSLFSEPVTLVDLISLSVFITQILLALLGVVFFLSGCDDLFIDICFVVWKASRRFRNRDSRGPSERDLLSRPEKPVAVFIPAWDESDVIRPMLSNIDRKSTSL